MKKTFKLSHEKIQSERWVESIKHEVKKYIKRERNKPLTGDADFLEFDCKFGASADGCDEIHLSEINKSIDDAVNQGLDSFYLEILSKPSYRAKKS